MRKRAHLSTSSLFCGLLALVFLIPLHGTSTSETKSKLTFLSIGVNHKALEKAERDEFAEEAMLLENAVEGNCSRLYNIRSRHLHGKDATRDNCLVGLRWVSNSSVGSDLVMIYITSHGSGDSKGNYRFYPATGSISSGEMVEQLQKVKCPLFLLIDTCHAESFLIDWRTIPDNVSILVACQAERSAYVWMFVRPLVRSFWEADYDGDGRVDLGEVEEFVIRNIDKRQTVVATRNRSKIVLSKSPRWF